MPFGPSGKPEFDGPFDPRAEEQSATHRLGEALNHLHAFAATFNTGDYVDEESALTADDLNVILETLEKVHGLAKVAPRL